jgi:hypothetical protein
MDEPRREAVREHWLALPMGLYFRDRTPDAGPAVVQIELPDQPIVLETTAGGGVAPMLGRRANADATETGAPGTADCPTTVVHEAPRPFCISSRKPDRP